MASLPARDPLPGSLPHCKRVRMSVRNHTISCAAPCIQEMISLDQEEQLKALADEIAVPA